MDILTILCARVQNRNPPRYTCYARGSNRVSGVLFVVKYNALYFTGFSPLCLQTLSISEHIKIIGLNNMVTLDPNVYADGGLAVRLSS